MATEADLLTPGVATYLGSTSVPDPGPAVIGAPVPAGVASVPSVSAPAAPASLVPAPTALGAPTMANAARAGDQAYAAGLEAARAKEGEGSDRAAEALANADERDKVAAEAALQANERKALADAQDRARQATDAKVAQADQAVKDWQPRDYWKDADGNTRWGAKIAAAVFAGLGGLGMRENGGHNAYLDDLSRHIDAFGAAEKQRLNTAENFQKLAREDRDNVEQNWKIQQGQLDLIQSKRTDSVADQMKAQLIRNGVPAEQAENNVDVQQMIQKAAETRATGREKIAQANAEIALKGATLAASKGPTQDVTSQAISDLRDGIPVAKVAAKYSLDAKSLKTIQDIASSEERSGFAATKAAGSNDARTVRDVDGNPLGLAPTGRNVQKVQEDIRNLMAASEKLGRLQKMSGPMSALPAGPEFNDAVGAVATVSPLGKSDESVRLEKGALTGLFGNVSSSAVATKKAEIDTKIERLKAQLQPLSAPPGVTSKASDIDDFAKSFKL